MDRFVQLRFGVYCLFLNWSTFREFREINVGFDKRKEEEFSLINYLIISLKFNLLTYAIVACGSTSVPNVFLKGEKSKGLLNGAVVVSEVIKAEIFSYWYCVQATVVCLVVGHRVHPILGSVAAFVSNNVVLIGCAILSLGSYGICTTIWGPMTPITDLIFKCVV